MKQIYPYYVAVKIAEGKLLKLYKDKKFKSYSECYEILNNWSTVHQNSYFNGQYAIVEYTSQYDGKIVTIITEAVETRLLTPLKF
jgi:hypothetical protein